MKTIILLALSLSASAFSMNAQSDIVTETFSVSGNCGMCKKTIEKATQVKGVKVAAWDPGSRILSLKYDKRFISADAVLRQVAYAGYDNEKYLAPQAAYNKLHGCCQYERTMRMSASPGRQQGPHDHINAVSQEKQEADGIEKLYAAYFALKDALVKSDAGLAAAKAGALLDGLETIKPSALQKSEQEAFDQYSAAIRKHAREISSGSNIEKQRRYFSDLSDVTFQLMKKIPPAYEVYLDHCPMYNDGKGADWISREKPIKNPYYGTKMLTCGNVKETLKK